MSSARDGDVGQAVRQPLVIEVVERMDTLRQRLVAVRTVAEERIGAYTGEIVTPAKPPDSQPCAPGALAQLKDQIADAGEEVTRIAQAVETL